MTAKCGPQPQPELPSDRGYLALAGEPDLPLRETFIRLRDLVSSDMDWAHARKHRFRTRAAWVKVITLVLTAASTVILGFTWLPTRATIALPMVAGVTIITALDQFFSWRSRWVLMEETQYRLNQVRDEMDYYLATTPRTEVTKAVLDRFFHEQQKIWAVTSKRWVDYRQIDSVTGDHSSDQSAS